MFAKVVVDVPSSNTDDTFTYSVPEQLAAFVRVGSRVYVEFGFQRVLGYVLALEEETDFSGSLKPILDVIDFEERLAPEQIELAKKIAADTKTYLTSALALMYPSFLKSKVRKFLQILDAPALDQEVASLFGNQKRIPLTGEVLKKYELVKREIEKGNLEITTQFYRYGKNKTEKYYRLKRNDYGHLSPKRCDVLDFVKARGEATLDEILENTGSSDYLVGRLVKDDYLLFDERVPLYTPLEEIRAMQAEFNFEQQQLKEKFSKLSGKPFLLHTNDEEFKLDFLLALAVETVSQGKQVLIVAPTLLVHARILEHFRKNTRGYRLFAFSSKLSNSEYYHNYANVRNQNADIVIGMKSHVFLPLNRLGLIVMLDEEDPNYHVEQTPKYSVLEVLKFRSGWQQAKLLLTSSALRVESYYNYYFARYFYLEYVIPREVRTRLVNMRREAGDLLLSEALRGSLREKLGAGEVSLLILNNLSYSTDVICEHCGHFQKCPLCRAGLVYHKQKNTYRCPSCNQEPARVVCENCGKSKFKHFGFGLERLKERLRELFPAARITQVDSESMQEKDAYEDLFSRLEENEIDIVIGTNQLAGLYHRNIKLIGIISLDSILNRNDYRSSEILFGLISKISRHEAEVILQGYNLNHPAIRFALENDFESFYEYEIENRKNFNYPPFAEFNKLEISGEYRDVYYYANYFKKIGARLLKGEFLGPVYDGKIKGVRLLIKHQNFERLSKLLDEVNKKFAPKKLLVNFERYPN